MNFNLKLLLSSLLLTFTTACSAPFNIDFPVPGQEVEPETVAPEMVDNVEAITNCRGVSVSGDMYFAEGRVCESMYEDLGLILVGKFDTFQDALGFFELHKKTMDSSSRTCSSSGDTGWCDTGLDGGGASFLWYKQRWVFEVAADDVSAQSKLVDAFDHISLD